MHQYATVAALAAEAADLQGKFWEMHDAIYENQNALNEKLLMGLARKLNLDMVEFEKDLIICELTEKVDADFDSGIISGVNGTPSVFINGKKFEGSAVDLFQLIRAQQ